MIQPELVQTTHNRIGLVRAASSRSLSLLRSPEFNAQLPNRSALQSYRAVSEAIQNILGLMLALSPMMWDAKEDKFRPIQEWSDAKLELASLAERLVVLREAVVFMELDEEIETILLSMAEISTAFELIESELKA